MDTEDIIGPKEGSKLLGISITTFHNAKKRGDLPEPAYSVSGRDYYAKSQLVGLKVKRPRGGWKARKK